MVKDLTTGNPLKLILFFSLPMVIGNLFQQFYNMADSIVVGQFLGVNALAAVGSTGSISFLVLGSPPVPAADCVSLSLRPLVRATTRKCANMLQMLFISHWQSQC